MKTRSMQGIGAAKGPRTKGFSLIELLTVIAIIAIIVSIFLPSMGSIRNGTEVVATVADLKNFAAAFRTYSLLEGGYPDDTHETIPSGLEDYLSPQSFEREAPITGRYNWEGPDEYAYAGISFTTTTADTETLTLLDHQIDDGNLTTGFFRQTPNGRYTYILEEL